MRRCSALIFVLMTSLVAFGQGLQWVGIDNRVANLMARHQEKDEWCWAASTQMILNYYGVQMDQAAIVQKIHGNEDDEPGSDDDITNALNGWVPTIGGRRVVHAVHGDGLPEPDALLAQLQQGQPILLTFSTGPRSGHAVVITAAGYRQTASGSQILSLIIRDPWPSPEHVMGMGRVQYNNLDLSAFTRTVRGYWLISVSDVHQSDVDLGADKEPSSRESANSCSAKYDDCIDQKKSLDSCVKEYHDGCMTSCQQDYGNSYGACLNNFCRPDNGPNSSWGDTCRRLDQIATDRCVIRKRQCDRRSSNE